MNVMECFRIAIDGLKSNRLRSFLTMLGVIIGVAAVIAVLAIAQGGKASILGEFQGLGANLIWAYPNYEESGDRPVSFTMDDLKMVKDNCPNITATTTEMSLRMTAENGSARENIVLYGIDENYFQVRKVLIAFGRPFTKEDITAARRVAILGQKTASALFPESNPIGETVRIGNRSYLVIGLMEEVKESMTGGSVSNDTVLVPITALQRLIGTEDLWIIYAEAKDEKAVPAAIEEMKQALMKKYEENQFSIFSMESILSSVNKVTSILSAVIAGIAGISLLVGGIGIMNIMLVSVTERTREIGLRKAIGATKSNILTQFLIEAVVLSALGGIIGIILGYLLVFIVSLAANLPSLVTWWSILIALSFSAGVGIFFGIWPANKAANLDPIEALRYE